MKHLIAVPQLFGHDAQHPVAIFIVLGARQGPGMLLNRTELRGGLRANDGQQVTRLFFGELVR